MFFVGDKIRGKAVLIEPLNFCYWTYFYIAISGANTL